MRHKLKLITLYTLCHTAMVNADVGSALTDYYNSLQANSKIERPTATTNGFTAGGYYQRGANVDLTLGYITPPSLKGGCGNIDFNMGAFSFISGDQIVAALKAIGQNAKALLFTEAIDIVSAQLGGNIKNWIDQANKWLGILKNSCQASSMLVGALNNSAGLCQNAARYKNSLSDENTVQSTCQTYDQGIKPYKEIFGSNTDDAKNAKSALATQIKLQGGIVQNMLADYFNSAGKINEMKSDLGNLVLSVIGDVYIPPVDANSDDNTGQAQPVAVPAVGFKLSDLLALKVADISQQVSDSNWKLYNCDFTYDDVNYRAKNNCFNLASKSYKTADGKNAAALQQLIGNKLKIIHDKMLNRSPDGITDADLTVIGLADAPIYQLMQAGIDAGMDDMTYKYVQTWMDYTVHKVYLKIFTDISDFISKQITTLKNNSLPSQVSMLSGIKKSFDDARGDINEQLVTDHEENKLDPFELLAKLYIVKDAIAKSVSPSLKEQLSFSSTISQGS